jgi:hypothetical protein
MYELSKIVLEKVSFDKSLFHKELTKAFKCISTDERILLKLWCLSSFGTKYAQEILDVFKEC